MKRMITLLLALMLVAVFSTPIAAAGGDYSVQAFGFLSVDCGQESFLTRLVASPIGEEGSLLWVGGSESSYLVVDRQGLVTTPVSYDFGAVGAGSTISTGLDYFTLTNNGEYAVDVIITATDMTGGIQWTLSDTATPGEDIFGLRTGLSGGSYNIVVKSSDGNELVGSLGAGGTQDWGLQLLAPTIFSDGVEKSGTVVLTIAIS